MQPKPTRQDQFIEKVKAYYLEDPGRISNISFWKLERFLKESETYEVHDRENTCLYAIRESDLLFYWSNATDRFFVQKQEMERLRFLILHDDYYRLIEKDLTGFTSNVSFPLFYDFHDGWQRSEGRRDLSDFQLRPFNFEDPDEYEEAARLVNATDTVFGLRLSAENVKRWTESAAFEPSLWLWALRAETPVGIIVSYYYPPIQETDIDWLYVLPQFQGQGVGRMLMEETIARSRNRSRIIRVTGVADQFYVKCGFKKGDKWHVIRKA